MKYFINGTWINDDTISVLPDGAVELTDAEWNDRQNAPYQPTPEQLEAKRIQDLKKIRNAALDELVHDFGDGRIMQTRPEDESNIRNAIEIMTTASIPSIGWSMIDDVKQAITVTDLQEALLAGQMAALQIWGNYNP